MGMGIHNATPTPGGSLSKLEQLTGSKLAMHSAKDLDRQVRKLPGMTQRDQVAFLNRLHDLGNQGDPRAVEAQKFILNSKRISRSLDACCQSMVRKALADENPAALLKLSRLVVHLGTRNDPKLQQDIQDKASGQLVELRKEAKTLRQDWEKEQGIELATLKHDDLREDLGEIRALDRQIAHLSDLRMIAGGGILEANKALAGEMSHSIATARANIEVRINEKYDDLGKTLNIQKGESVDSEAIQKEKSRAREDLRREIKDFRKEYGKLANMSTLSRILTSFLQSFFSFFGGKA